MEMDIENLTHSGYKLSVLIAIILSMMVVTLAAMLGRGTLNLKSALLLDKPSYITVIAALEPKLPEHVSISAIDFLRMEKRGEKDKPYYAYQVKTSDNEYHLVKIGYDEDLKQWTLMNYEFLHVDPVNPVQPAGE